MHKLKDKGIELFAFCQRSVGRSLRFFIVVTLFIIVCVLLFKLRSGSAVEELTLPKRPGYVVNSRVTRIIHQSWKFKTGLPKNFRKLRASWERCYPTWLHHFWTDEENRLFIATFYPWFLKTYDKLPSHICRVDVSRYFYLFHYGGVYTDLDNECVRPFDSLLANYSLVFGAMESKTAPLPEGQVQNSFMYSRPRHPFWLEVINYVTTHLKAAAPGYVTGSDALMAVINDYRTRFPEEAGNMKIYAPEFFNPLSWQRSNVPYCKTHNKMTEMDMAKCREHFKNAYVIQYHTHTW